MCTDVVGFNRTDKRKYVKLLRAQEEEKVPND